MASRNSIFYSSIRALCVSFFVIIGIAIGFVVVMLVLSAIGMGSSKATRVVGPYTVMPGADGKQPDQLERHTPLILHVDIAGVIGAEQVSAASIRDQLERSQSDGLEGRIHGVLLNINTPGGSAFDSSAIYRAIAEYKKRYQVPVYVWVDGLCASGGMYSAVAADKIYASDVSLIGSIGVIAHFFNVTETLQKIGVQALTLYRGKDKAALSPFKPWTPDEEKDMNEIIDYLYDQFVDTVVKARPQINRQRLVEEYGARVFPAPRAQELGYIDGVLTDQADVLRRLAADAGISEDYQVIRLDSRNWLHTLFSSKSNPMHLTHEIKAPGFNKTQQLEGYLYLYQPPGS